MIEKIKLQREKEKEKLMQEIKEKEENEKKKKENEEKLKNKKKNAIYKINNNIIEEKNEESSSQNSEKENKSNNKFIYQQKDPMKISKSILIIEFDKLIANALIYNKGEILNKLIGKDIIFDDISYDKVDELLNLIKNVYENYEGIELTFEKIKTYCEEQINSPLKIYEYDQNEILQNSIKYINSLYDN